MNEQQHRSSRSNRAWILAMLIIAILALCLGVYFGLFVGMRVFGGG